MASDRGKDAFKPKKKKNRKGFSDITSKITSNDVSRSAIKVRNGKVKEVSTELHSIPV